MRKQKIKKILYLLAAGVLLLMSMSGCGKEAETGKTQVAMIVKSTESAFFKSVFAGARAAATEYNLNVTFNGPESEEDYVTQNEMVRWITMPMRRSSVRPPREELRSLSLTVMSTAVW